MPLLITNSSLLFVSSFYLSSLFQLIPASLSHIVSYPERIFSHPIRQRIPAKGFIFVQFLFGVFNWQFDKMPADMSAFYTPTTPTHVSSQCSHSPPIVDELISKYSSSMAAANNTPTVPYTKQHRNLALRLVDWVCLEYYRYEVTFGVYMMSPGEKFVANTLVLFSLSLLLWASLLYLSHLLLSKADRLVWLLTGHSEHATGLFATIYLQLLQAQVRRNEWCTTWSGVKTTRL
jgi:hypothetical protein